MTRVIAIGAVSGLGRGEQAFVAGPVGKAAPTAIREDAALAKAGLRRARASRASEVAERFEDRATDLLVDALEQATSELDRIRPQWRAERIGLCVGTSSGGMISAERFFADLAGERTPRDVVSATYFAPLDAAMQALALSPSKHCQVVAACASSTIAIGLAKRWLARDACDVVLAGGYDGLPLFVAAGFEALRATSASMPKPFRIDRDGMLLGEGAGIVALTGSGAVSANRAEDDEEATHFFVRGFGASADAVHITAPDREGSGLIRAGTAALEDAGCTGERIQLVSAHGTSTPYNDAAEAKAIHALCGDPWVHPFKAQIGHTLGAAGVLELLSAAHALKTQVAPAAFGEGVMDPEATVRLLERASPQPLEAALKLSAAFGGVTAALVVERTRAAHRPTRAAIRAVRVSAYAHITDVDRKALAEASGLPLQKVARIDELGQLALAAVSALARDVGRDTLAGAGIVGGYSLATLDTNRRFHERLLKKGPRWVDPRLFPATSPNAGTGHCAIAFDLTGPCFAVNAGLAGSLEALVAAGELIASGDADRMVVVAADDDGPASREWLATAAPTRPHARGAVALWLTVVDDAKAQPAPADLCIDLDMVIPHGSGPVGHLALRQWLHEAGG